ncbi:hypothetical protein AGRA3207_004917 [Actinomadura graeca]|uniref:Uncharacterized protein n=1 Tax=Actinomadura graeca TaxID=2750812 RepID=A0ABX8R3Y2_9ACTN|nr:hypothetical protein [Actinomadura graeca]QXJ23723.1 hypothetical protein AGRA3207_004917 [Actinomadura graeca]
MSGREEALRALSDGLVARGIAVRTYATNLIVTGRNERQFLITCRNGRFRWGLGDDIGPITDVDGAVRHVADALVCPP